MKKPIVKLFLLVLGVVLYDYLFWENYFGINALLFTLLPGAYAFILEPVSIKNRNTLITACGTLLAAILVVTHNSVTSIVALIISFVAFVGFYFQPQLRSAAAALPTGLLNFIAAPFRTVDSLTKLSGTSSKTTSLWSIVRISVIPFFVFLIFYLLYVGANPEFNRLSSGLFEKIANTIENLFEETTWVRLFFIALGALIITGILVNGNIRQFMIWDNKAQDALETSPVEPANESANLFSRKDEYRIGILLMGLLNILILIVNVIDIDWLWFGFEYSNKMNLSQLVHEGTYLLIFSIVLAIAIMVFIFRGYLNYAPNSIILRYLAYAWIIQNGVMAISVVIRNYHYIYYYGLAYKRIGVLVFLALTVFGLCILAIKISRKRSFYYLMRTFSWAVYAMLISISLFNWDLIIAKHNTTHRYPENIDIRFLLSLSDKSLHIIAQNDSILDLYQNPADSTQVTYFRKIFNQRVVAFMGRQENSTWQEWNYPEQVTYNYFQKNKLP